MMRGHPDISFIFAFDIKKFFRSYTRYYVSCEMHKDHFKLCQGEKSFQPQCQANQARGKPKISKLKWTICKHNDF